MKYYIDIFFVRAFESLWLNNDEPLEHAFRQIIGSLKCSGKFFIKYNITTFIMLRK